MEKFGAVDYGNSVPETIRSPATTGERLLFRTLKPFLPEDDIVYYEPEIRGKRPDFEFKRSCQKRSLHRY